jgi:hypothetical protein
LLEAERRAEEGVRVDVGEARCFSPTDRSVSMCRVVFADYKCQILQCVQCTLHCCKSKTIVKRVVHLVRNVFFFQLTKITVDSVFSVLNIPF